PLLVAISGPTAVGKTTVLRRLRTLDRPYHVVVTVTTRAPRPGEAHGRDYFFVTPDEFRAMAAQGAFLEYARVHGTDYYGTPRAQVREALARGLDVIVPPDVQGAAAIRAAVPGAVTIFLAARSLDELERRLRLPERGHSEEEIQRRLATARMEMARLHEFDYLVINEEGRLDATVLEIDLIIQAEKRRVRRAPIAV
ncbi:MAG: guanylate kinase, partial [Chloroflexota bacterium]